MRGSRIIHSHIFYCSGVDTVYCSGQEVKIALQPEGEVTKAPQILLSTKEEGRAQNRNVQPFIMSPNPSLYRFNIEGGRREKWEY